jgi:hypothetical protein
MQGKKWEAGPAVATAMFTLAIVQTADLWARGTQAGVNPRALMLQSMGSVFGSIVIGGLVAAVVVWIRNRLA